MKFTVFVTIIWRSLRERPTYNIDKVVHNIQTMQLTINPKKSSGNTLNNIIGMIAAMIVTNITLKYTSRRKERIDN